MTMLRSPSSDEENRSPSSSPVIATRSRGRTPKKLGATPNVLRTSRRHPHSNSKSPSSKRDRRDPVNGKRSTGGEIRHIHWSFDGDSDPSEDTTISPASLDRNLEERGIVGVYIHDDHETPADAIFRRGSHASSSSSGHQRTGLQRRLNSNSNLYKDNNNEGSFDSIDGIGNGTTTATTVVSSDMACRRILRSTRSSPLLRGASRYSSTAKRRMMVMGLAVGLALTGYFVEIREIMRASGGHGGGGNGEGNVGNNSRKDWLVGLPRSFSSSILGKGGVVGGGAAGDGEGAGAPAAAGSEGDVGKPSRNDHQHITSMEEEWRRVRAMSRDRAEGRRARTRPPSAHPTVPGETFAAGGSEGGSGGGAADADGVVVASIPPPRLALDLPAHRVLDGSPAVEHRVLQALEEEAAAAAEYEILDVDNGDEGEGRARRHLRQGNQKGGGGGGRGGKSAPVPQAICGPEAHEASQLDPSSYPDHARVGPQSRVVITGALTQVGVELILQMYENCRVRFIVGIDSAYPNTRHERMDLIESRYEYVHRRVPGFQRLVVPVFGIHPHPRMGEEVRFESMDNGYDVVRRLNPTHIVHLAGMEEGRGEHTDYGDTVGASPFVEGGEGSMMRRFDGLLSIDQVLSSLARFRKERPGDPQPQLVYVSSNEAGDRSGVPLASKDGAGGNPASVYGTTSLLKEVLASYYHRHHGVDSVGLRVPAIFGPFSRPGSVLHDLAERTVRNAVGDIGGVPKHHTDMDRYELSSMWEKREGAASGEREQLAYVYDVAGSILAAMQFRKDYAGGKSPVDPGGPTLLRIGSKIAASAMEMKEIMEGWLPPADQEVGGAVAPRAPSFPEAGALNSNGLGISIVDTQRNRDLLGWAHKTSLASGASSALAWQVLEEYPFGLPASAPSRPAFQALIEASMKELSYHRLPCASGCGWAGIGMCSESPWDAVIETTKEITQSCPYVLYTVDLRPELNHLEKHSKPSQRKGWEDWFCKIAFVSAQSKLAKRHYLTELARNDPISEWNGKNKAGQWILVVLDGSTYDMKEWQRSLAKMTPTFLFNERVEKAMYVNHRKVILTTDQAMGVMRHLDMDEQKKPQKKTIFDEKTKENVDIYLPPHPQRHSLFFTNKYSMDGFDTSSAKNLANFVMTNAGIPETKDIRAQMQFYEQAAHLTRTNMQRSPNYQEFFQDNFFPFDFLRSSWLVHELRSEEGRNLRCEMYQEHALWGNAEMEDMSMAFVLAKRKVRMQLGKVADQHYAGPEDWYPLLVPSDLEDKDAITEGPVYLNYLEESQKVMTDSRGHEFYITFLPQKRKE